MLERYFIRPDTIDRIRGSWIGVPIEQYVTWLAEQGYAARTIYRRVPLLVRFGGFAERRGAQAWDDLPAHIDAFVTDWVTRHGAGKSTGAQRRLQNFAHPVVEQMIALAVPGWDMGNHRPSLPDPFLDPAPGFFAYLRDERGLRETSIRHYRHFLRRFEAYLRRIGCGDLGALSPPILSGFIIKAAGDGLSRSSMTGLCSALRVFLHYLHRQGIIARDLARCVEPPQNYRMAELPRSIGWDDVRRMLEAVDRRIPVGRRDYAILLLLVTYGLRAREVAALTLDDIDWKRERLLVRERKADHTTAYPLSPTVGEAILDYLRHGRPETEDRHLFFRHLAPHRPLTFAAVSGRASHYLHKAGVSVRRPGSHTLRHACVQRLLDAGFPLKTIGDYVGHRSASSTEIYAKVALDSLRDVALGDGEALP
ncbi:MAG: site-specific integrase [Candidatus Krumholzibacteriia bacterium]